MFGSHNAFSPHLPWLELNGFRVHWVHYIWKLDSIHLQTHRLHTGYAAERGWVGGNHIQNEWMDGCRWCTWLQGGHFGMLPFSLSIEWLTQYLTQIYVAEMHTARTEKLYALFPIWFTLHAAPFFFSLLLSATMHLVCIVRLFIFKFAVCIHPAKMAFFTPFSYGCNSTCWCICTHNQCNFLAPATN